MDVSCTRPFLLGTSLEPAVIPTAQASSFTLHYFTYYLWCSKYSCLYYYYYHHHHHHHHPCYHLYAEYLQLYIWNKTFSGAYSAAVVRYLQSVLHVTSPVKYASYFYISTFCSMCAVSNMADICSSLISCFPGMLLRYCLSAFEMVPVTIIIIIIIITTAVFYISSIYVNLIC